MRIESNGAPESPRGVGRYAPRSMTLDQRTPVVVGVGQVATPPDAGLDPAARPEPLELMAAALLRRGRGLRRRPGGRGGPGRARASSGAPTASGSWRRWAGRSRIRLAWWRRVSASPRATSRPSSWSRPSAATTPRPSCTTPVGPSAGASATSCWSRAPRPCTPAPWRAGTRPGPGCSGPPSPRARRPPRSSASRSRAPPSSRCSAACSSRCTPTPCSRTRFVRPTAGRCRSTAPASARCGPASARSRPPTRTRGSAPPARPRTSSRPGPATAWCRSRTPSSARPTCRSTRAPPPSCARWRRPAPPVFPTERWVFPLAGADGNDHWFISERPELHRSPAIRLAGAAALEQAGLGIDDIAFVDLYSCFPVVVQMAAHELGLAVDDPDRPLTLTGGLTFGGGPGNNYTSHGIAQRRRRAAERTGQRGAGQRAGVVRHQALPRGLRVTPAGARRRAALRLAGRAARRRRAAALPRRSRRRAAPSASRRTP